MEPGVGVRRNRPSGKMTPTEDFLVVSTMDDAREPGHLNSSQRLHLLTSCQYADKLLSEIGQQITRLT
jgi:hypothetical protein